MFGRERDRTGILIEPADGIVIDMKDPIQLIHFIDRIWPTVEEANKDAPSFSRIFKEMILVTSEAKPLPRAGKGTVMRKAALLLYEPEIVALFDAMKYNIETVESIAPPATWSIAGVEVWIMEQAVSLTKGVNLTPSSDLFEQGFDSLSATFLRLRIIKALHASRTELFQPPTQDISQNLVYSHPIIHDLAVYVMSLLEAREIQSNPTSRHVDLIEEMIEKYSVGLDDLSANCAFEWTTPAIVLVTGSTGNLGSEILAALLGDSRVKHIYAFNRPPRGELSIQERHVNRFKERGFRPELLESDKLSFVSGDATQPNLGLDHGQYSQLCVSVNVVIHNAWKLDFNLSLSSFEPHIKGTRHLIDLVKSGPNPTSARFLFTSSIASAHSWPRSKGPYPEEIVTDASFAVGGGYGESKYVAERIIAKSGLQATSLRIAQLCGGQPKGAWAVTDWVPILVKSSTTIGLLPDLEGGVSWVPVCAAAAAIADAALGHKTWPHAVNLVHPRPTTAEKVIDSIRASIAEAMGRELKVVSFKEWLAVIDEHARHATPNTLIDIPAIKLLDFFRSLSQGNDDILWSKNHGYEMGGLAMLSTERMHQVSHSVMGRLDSIGREDVSLWIKYWREVDFLS
ncbi:hypothetical protein C0991_005483 [Blastosporella zonata]|nr:hypothetical protein C0991_005483 [Blastosporella zonata]